MRRRHWLSALLLLTVILVSSAGSGAELELRGLAGGSLTETDLASGTHIIVFWTSWAPRGRDIVDRVNALQAKWSGSASVVTVNFQEDAGAVRAFLEGKAALKTRVFLDEQGDFSKKYRVNSAPWLLILKNGGTAFSEKLPNDADALIGQILG